MEEIDPLKVEVCDINPAMEGYIEPSSLEEKVDLGNLVLFPPDSYVNKDTETEEVKFVIKEETSENNISDKAVIMEEVIEPPVHEYEKTQIEFSTNSNVKCQTCGLEFGNKVVLKIHNSMVHPEGKKIDQNYSAPSPNPSVDSTLRSLLKKQSELSKQGGIFLKNS